MKTLLDPKSIYQKILKNEINSQEGIEYLISIIEKSENSKKRIESLEILRKLQISDKKVFRILENCVISDESDQIRVFCATFILEKYFESGLNCLEWVILNDKSSRLLKILGNTINSSKIHKNSKLHRIFLQRLENIAKEFNLNALEVPFLLDIEFDLSRYHILNWNLNSRLIFDTEIMFQIQDQHISELSISLRDKIPPSIRLLEKLQNLNLSCNNLTELPESLTELKHLKSLDLSWNEFKVLPTLLKRLKSIDKINFQNNLV
jgi:hypothetical protein